MSELLTDAQLTEMDRHALAPYLHTEPWCEQMKATVLVLVADVRRLRSAIIAIVDAPGESETYDAIAAANELIPLTPGRGLPILGA